MTQESQEKVKPVNFLQNKTQKLPDLKEKGETIETKKIINKKGLLLIFLIIGLIAGLTAFAYHNFNEANHANPDSLANRLQPKKFGFFKSVKDFLFSADDVMAGQKEDRINILLLGIGGAGHDGPYLSDTNIIASIKPSTQEISLISIPRDLGVKIDDYGIYKINAADAFGENKNPGQGGDYARTIFEQTFGISIPYYVRVDFNAFEEIINAIDGITVDVKNSFTDYSFPGANYSYQTVNFDQGIQTMNGDLALKFARSRHGTNGESSDFARSRRQQQIMEAVKEKVVSVGTLTNPIKLQKIWDSAANNIATNMEAGQLLYLINLVKDIPNQKIKNVVLDSSPEGYLYSYIAESGAFLLSPKSGNFDEINSVIANVFDPNFIPPTPTKVASTAYSTSNSTLTNNLVKNTASNTSTNNITTSTEVIPMDSVILEIQNGTWIGGLASRYQSRLADKGFFVVNIGNSIKKPIEETVIYVIDPAAPQESLNRITDIIPGRIELGLPNWLKEDSTGNATDGYHPQADILIILGNDIKEQ